MRCVRAGHPAPGTRYALKVLFNYGHGTATVSSAFEREHAVLSLLPPHAGVVRFLREYVERIPDAVYAVLPEFARAQAEVPGPDGAMRRRKTQFVLLSYHESTLATLMRRRREAGTGVLPWPVVHRLSVELLAAAQHLFANGVAHLDVKPDNVLVDHDDDVNTATAVLADLGCSMKCPVGCWDVPVSIITVSCGFFSPLGGVCPSPIPFFPFPLPPPSNVRASWS